MPKTTEDRRSRRRSQEQGEVDGGEPYNTNNNRQRPAAGGTRRGYNQSPHGASVSPNKQRQHQQSKSHQHHQHQEQQFDDSHTNHQDNEHNAPCPSFDAMGLKPDLLKGIYAYGFEKPSAIQQRAIRPIVRGRDVIAQSQSGTGKTVRRKIIKGK